MDQSLKIVTKQLKRGKRNTQTELGEGNDKILPKASLQ